MQTGFMDNMLSMFPLRLERFPCPGAAGCQTICAESAVREGVNKISCLQLGRWGEKAKISGFSSMKRNTDIKLLNSVLSEALIAGFRLAPLFLIHRKSVEKIQMLVLKSFLILFLQFEVNQFFPCLLLE